MFLKKVVENWRVFKSVKRLIWVESLTCRIMGETEGRIISVWLDWFQSFKILRSKTNNTILCI